MSGKPDEVSTLVIYITMEKSKAERVIALWEAKNTDLMAKADEMGIVAMEVFDHTHEPIED